MEKINSINEHLLRLDSDGFTILPNLISETDCNHFKALLEFDFDNYHAKYISSKECNSQSLADKSGEKVVYNLHNKNLKWFSLFENEEVIAILKHILQEGSYNNSEPFYLNNISARTPLKGFKGQQLHTDSNLPGVNYCLIANVLWALDDFTVQNGATRVVPGSHRLKKFPADGASNPDEIRITANKGSAIIFNANLWHGGAENTTNNSRGAVALGYARWFIKPSFDFMQNTPTDIYNRMTENQKKLLGFHLLPPRDEFTRLRRRSNILEVPFSYHLPSNKEN